MIMTQYSVSQLQTEPREEMKTKTEGINEELQQGDMVTDKKERDKCQEGHDAFQQQTQAQTVVGLGYPNIIHNLYKTVLHCVDS